MIEYLQERTDSILLENGFSENGEYSGPDKKFMKEKMVSIEGKKIFESATQFSDIYELDELLKNPVGYELPEKTVNISIDDVNVKKQEPVRPERIEPKEIKRKYVHNTIVHIEKGPASYTLSGGGINFVLKIVLAFILENGLKENRFQFFTDGHTILNTAILNFFSRFRNIGIILDWYHLEKKCREQLSMVFKNRQIRNQVLEELMPLLWYGLTDKAIKVLKEIEDGFIKNSAAMEKLIAYLERNKAYIPSYAIRKNLGLRNGSSIGEKMNDLIVSDRQKHNGMSWSHQGSVSLAALTCLKRNNEYKKWFQTGEIEFKFAA